AVAIGLVVETRVGELMRVARPGTANQVADLLQHLELPVTVPAGLDRTRMMDLMRSDKKNRDGKVRAALLAGFGDAARDNDEWTHPLDLEIVATLI
ncbi:MAG: 3-dehydroquinate synthase family protein, partial [Gemmatimonadales bacterium]